MTKYVLVSIMSCAVFLLLNRNVCAQDSRKTVAVLQAESKSVNDEIKGGITGALEEGVFKSGEYKLLARGDAYQKAVAVIKNDLIEGTVSDDQLIQLGNATGADLVCYATVSKYSDNLFRIAYKMIDVASSEIVNVGSESVRNGVDGLLTATDNIAKKLFGGVRGDGVATPNPTPPPKSTPTSKPIPTPASTPTPKPTITVSPIVRGVLELVSADLGSKAYSYRTDEERLDKVGVGGKIEDLIKFSAKTVITPPSVENNQILFFCLGENGKGRNDLAFLFIDGKMIAATMVLNGFAAIVPNDGLSHLITVWRNSSKIFSAPANFSQKREYQFVWVEKKIQIQ